MVFLSAVWYKANTANCPLQAEPSTSRIGCLLSLDWRWEAASQGTSFLLPAGLTWQMTALSDSAPKGWVPFDLDTAPSLTNSIPYAPRPLQKDRPHLLRIRGGDYRLIRSSGDVSSLSSVSPECLLYVSLLRWERRGSSRGRHCCSA